MAEVSNGTAAILMLDPNARALTLPLEYQSYASGNASQPYHIHLVRTRRAYLQNFQLTKQLNSVATQVNDETRYDKEAKAKKT